MNPLAFVTFDSEGGNSSKRSRYLSHTARASQTATPHQIPLDNRGLDLWYLSEQESPKGHLDQDKSLQALDCRKRA